MDLTFGLGDLKRRLSIIRNLHNACLECGSELPNFDEEDCSKMMMVLIVIAEMLPLNRLGKVLSM